jgi:hypothetical protein
MEPFPTKRKREEMSVPPRPFGEEASMQHGLSSQFINYYGLNPPEHLRALSHESEEALGFTTEVPLADLRRPQPKMALPPPPAPVPPMAPYAIPMPMPPPHPSQMPPMPTYEDAWLMQRHSIQELHEIIQRLLIERKQLQEEREIRFMNDLVKGLEQVPTFEKIRWQVQILSCTRCIHSFSLSLSLSLSFFLS